MTQRIRLDYMTGDVADNPLLFDATEFNSPELAAVPEIVSGQHAVIVFDPTGIGAGPETARIVSHDAGATIASVNRGQEGTDAVQHEAGTMWAWSPAASDYLQIVGDETELPITDGLPYSGMMAYDLLGSVTTPGAPAREGLLIQNDAGEWERPWNMAWGYVNAYTAFPVSGLWAGGIDNDPQDLNLQFTYNERAGRTYKIAAAGDFRGSALNVFKAFITDGANVVLRGMPECVLTSGPFGTIDASFSGSYEYTATANGSKTVKLRGYRKGAGDPGEFGGFSGLAFLRGYDMGPATDPAVI